MDATNMIPAYSLVDDGDFYTMKTENGGVHYLLPELFPFFRSIHNQIYIYAMHPHPISGHIPPDVCVGCVFQPLSQFVVNGKQLFLQAVTVITSPILRLSLTDFSCNRRSNPTVSTESSGISTRSVLFILQDERQQSNRRKQTLFIAFCISSP